MLRDLWVCVFHLQARVVEAIRIMNELRKMPGTDHQKFITEFSDQAKDNPLLPNLLNIAKRAGVTGLEEGEHEERGLGREALCRLLSTHSCFLLLSTFC